MQESMGQTRADSTGNPMECDCQTVPFLVWAALRDGGAALQAPHTAHGCATSTVVEKWIVWTAMRKMVMPSAASKTLNNLLS